tara:strand:+ start:226 stop:516 length:291 start_codon:yes stop_codon:yes gene_type:complete
MKNQQIDEFISTHSSEKWSKENIYKCIANWNHFAGEFLDELISLTADERTHVTDKKELDLIDDRLMKLTQLKNVSRNIIRHGLSAHKDYGRGYDIK